MNATHIIVRTARATYRVEISDLSVWVWDDVSWTYTPSTEITPATERWVRGAARRLLTRKCDENHQLHFDD